MSAESLEVPHVQMMHMNGSREGGPSLAPGLGESKVDHVHDTPRGGPWHALWTRSHCERPVWDQLTAKGFHVFLPTIDVWSRRAGVRRRIQVPMFPGYLFLRHAVDKTSYTEVRKTRGLVCLLGEGWDRLAVIPTCEIEAIQRIVQTHTPVLTHMHLRTGMRVRITHGPLANVEGILVRGDSEKGLLVISIELLKRSVAVEIDCTWAIPA